MGGPVYRYDAAQPVDDEVPASPRRAVLRRRVRPRLDQADRRQRRRLAAARSTPSRGPASRSWTWQFGPDGALYVLDYGTGYFNGDANSALYRIDYIGTAATGRPIAVAGANPTSGAGAADRARSPRPAAPTPRAARSPTPGTSATAPRSTAANPSHTYTTNGNYTATLTVTRPAGRAPARPACVISVGNTAPTVDRQPRRPTAQLFSFGDTVPFSVTVTDPEDGTIDCTR